MGILKEIQSIKEKLNIYKESKTLDDLYDMYCNDELIIDECLLDRREWGDERKERFIINFLADFDQQLIFINKDDDGNFSLCNNINQILTLFDFINDKFIIKDICEIPSLVDLKFSELDIDTQSFIKEKIININFVNAAHTSTLYRQFDNNHEYINEIFKGVWRTWDIYNNVIKNNENEISNLNDKIKSLNSDIYRLKNTIELILNEKLLPLIQNEMMRRIPEQIAYFMHNNYKTLIEIDSNRVKNDITIQYKAYPKKDVISIAEYKHDLMKEYHHLQNINPYDEQVQIYTIDHKMQSLHFSYNISKDLLERISHQIGIDQFNERKD